jgi:hypothetical protein
MVKDDTTMATGRDTGRETTRTAGMKDPASHTNHQTMAKIIILNQPNTEIGR